MASLVLAFLPDDVANLNAATKHVQIKLDDPLPACFRLEGLGGDGVAARYWAAANADDEEAFNEIQADIEAIAASKDQVHQHLSIALDALAAVIAYDVNHPKTAE